MANQTDPQVRLAQLFKQQKCYTIDQLSGHLNYSLISIRRFLKAMGYYSSFTHNSKCNRSIKIRTKLRREGNTLLS